VILCQKKIVIPSQVNLLDMDKSYLLKRKITDQEYCVRKCVRLFYKNLPDACCKKKIENFPASKEGKK
jgi:hypothetical protein